MSDYDKLFQVLHKEFSDLNRKFDKIEQFYIKNTEQYKSIINNNHINKEYSRNRKQKNYKFTEIFSYKTTNINYIYILALIFSIVFLISGITFILYASKLNKDSIVNYIQVATEQTKFAVNEHIREQFSALSSAAVLPENRELIAYDNFFNRMVKRLTDYNTYILAGIADRDGNAIWKDKISVKRGNISEELFFKIAITGEQAITYIKEENICGTDANFFAVPIWDEKNGDIKGIVFVADPKDEFSKIINSSLYAGKGLAHIIDSKGDYIIKSNSPLVVTIGDNIFELRTPLKKSVQEKTLENLTSGNSGYIEEAVYGENRLVSYTPLGINDWSVFYAVPEYMISADYKNIKTGVITIITIAVAVFISFIILIKQVNKNSREVLETLAFIDPLTGKRNYQKFLLDAAKILENINKEKYAICYCDVKSFKTINDIFGRETGDSLLQQLSNFIFEIMQEGEICGRVAGDVFVILQKYQTKQEIEARFESTAQRLAVFPKTFSSGYKVELYGGAYLINEDDTALTLTDMLDRAITAQKAAKTACNGKHFFLYTHEMREQKLWEAEVESKMEIALENNEFKVYLQPKIDIQNGNKVMGAEALVRWISPEKGLIPPIRFTDIFEKNGFIVKLDRFVFETACKYYKESVLDTGLNRYVLSVNVSRLGLMQPDFTRTYILIKELYRIPDGCIELEFTESLVFENHKLFQSIVEECRRNGFLCSLDDFGAGYSSLNILKSIHVDVLKLDGLFFRYGNDSDRGHELVKSIIAMAKSLNMKTVAEGVDEESLVDQLREMGCNAIQGYIFAKPMPFEEFKQFITMWNSNKNYKTNL